MPFTERNSDLTMLVKLTSCHREGQEHVET